MKRMILALVAALLITLCGCSKGAERKADFKEVNSNVTIWEDPNAASHLILAFEASNSTWHPLRFKEAAFDIVDENGKIVDTMQSVSAYPAIIDSDETAVYYGTKATQKITNKSMKLKAVPHIETEKSHKRNELGIQGLTGADNAHLIGNIYNSSSQTQNNVHIVVISRTASNKVDAVMTTTVDAIKPGEQKEFKVKYPINSSDLGTEPVTKKQFFAYTDPIPATEKQGNIMWPLITCALFLIICAGAVFLQIYLSKKGKWMGLLLPLATLIYSLISCFSQLQNMNVLPSTHNKFDEFGNLIESVTIEPMGGIGYIILKIILVFLIYNIGTLILLAIHWFYRKKAKNNE